MRLIIVANRVPVRKQGKYWVPAIGGLATALLPVLRERGGVWIGMSEDPNLPTHQPFPTKDPDFEIHRVYLTKEEVANYYDGMANKVLWPVSHYMVQHLELRRDFITDYRAINRRFAEAVVEVYQPGDVIWIHDYHLMLAPRYIREALPDARIAQFWHIPWPAMEVFRILPYARELVDGLLGCDLIGFHVDEYVKNFVESARVLLRANGRGDTLRWRGRQTEIQAHPIGIDVAHFEQMADNPKVEKQAHDIRDDIGTSHLLLGVDRLDYTKGILERLLAFEQFLHQNPDYHRRVSLLQIATPSRERVGSYRRLKREVDEVIGRINGTFGLGGWVPVHYRYRSYPQDNLGAFYRAADVGLITPLRDGMNLVAHEFIAANDRGLPVISELTGAAYYLEDAPLVNPYDKHAVAATIKEVLQMPEEEKARRRAHLKAAVARLDVHRWTRNFLGALRETEPEEIYAV